MSQLRTAARVVLAIPTLSTARRSVSWIDAMASLQMPLGSSLGRVWLEDKPVAEARNELCRQAVISGAQYLVFLSDDVLPPPHMIIEMLDKIGHEYPVENGKVARASMVTGVYWTKSYPTEPYLWNGLLQGSYRDWTAGEFFPVDMAGCDALMIEVEMLKQIPYPWFSTDWVYEPEQEKPSAIATEDFYFYGKARKHGFRLFADTAIQCFHEDRTTGQMFGLTEDMRQAGGIPEEPGVLQIAELGAGLSVPAYDERSTVVRFDIRNDTRPDVRCDLRDIPEQYFNTFDVVHARHVFEHFSRVEAPELLNHWLKLLKVGGKIVIRVPNIENAMRRILEGIPDTYAWQQLYGEQTYPHDFHKNGFTPRKLSGLLRLCPLLRDVEVITENDDLNIKATAILDRHETFEAIGPWWRAAFEEASPATVVPAVAGSSVAEGVATPAPSAPPFMAAEDAFDKYQLTYLEMP